MFFVLADASGVRGLETMEAEHVTDGSRKTENMLQRHVMHSIPAVLMYIKTNSVQYVYYIYYT